MDKVDQSRKRKAEGDDDFESKSKSAYLVSEFIALGKLLSRKRSPPSDDRAKDTNCITWIFTLIQNFLLLKRASANQCQTLKYLVCY